jgi:hypothetical protein
MVHISIKMIGIVCERRHWEVAVMMETRSEVTVGSFCFRFALFAVPNFSSSALSPFCIESDIGQ